MSENGKRKTESTGLDKRVMAQKKHAKQKTREKMGRRMTAFDETWRGGLYTQDRENMSQVLCTTQSELERVAR